MMALVFGAAVFLVFAVAHMALLRLGDALRGVGNIFLLAMGVHVAGTLACWLLDAGDYWRQAGVYWFLLMFWVYCYGTAAKSLTVRMLVRVARGAPVREEELAVPGEEDGLASRLQSLEAMGYAERAGQVWRATAEGRAAAERLRALQRRLNVSGSSLYGLDDA